MARLTSAALLLISAAIAVTAQQDTCASQVLVSSDGDLSSIASCSTFSGTATITGASLNTVAWPALKSLTGSIKVVSNPHLTTLSLENLQSSTGSISFFNNTQLSAVNMPRLKSINSLDIITAPSLRQLSLPSIESVNTLKVEDTGLDNSGNLPWSSLPKVSDLGVSNNKLLTAIDMPSLKAISGHLVIAANGLMEGQGKGASLHLPNLTSVSNCTLRHLTDLQVPSLTAVSSSLSFDETNLQTINVPLLKSVGQTLSIVSNNVLRNISFAELTSIGGALLIANNTELTDVSGFNKLKDISGVLNMRGAFNNVSLPAVTAVQGGMSVLSSSKDFDCSTLGKVKASARGKTVCQAQVKAAKPTNADGSDIDGASVGSSATAVMNTMDKLWVAAAVLSSMIYVL
ncbi:hypothetical protein BGZ99_003641 [Dissophora globulifera]|uniref:Uncharacterized protein n=1 Tax=Dissophora globulifera TaxID=979702 RepID=A0A9P6RU29_9FUNG|nr:hypothetical protein BGZ99_003641 [Dissophora globulifera]